MEIKDWRKTKKYQEMNLLDACMIAEDTLLTERDAEDYLTAFQWLVDTGQAWHLQGWYGREARRLIEEGLIKPKN